MKAISITLILLCIVLSGCLSPTKTVGRDLDETKINQIKKGVTTADGVVTLFGEPDNKEILSTNQVMWHYAYMNETRTTRNMIVTVVEQTAGIKKKLDILFQDETVINFAYVKAPIQSENTH